jgi:zinc transport system substrate-binding protein
MKKAGFYCLLLLVLFGLFTGCGATQASETAKQEKSGKVEVMVSFNALREIAEAIGKDKIEVKTIIPDGTEPHDFEPTARDLKELHSARVFVYNGFDMEKSWVDKALEAADNKNLIVVETAKGAEPIPASGAEEIESGAQNDPHLWLSLKGAEIEAKNVKDALIKADPVNKDFYEANYQTFYNQLETLYQEYNQKFQSVKSKNFVTGHAAFAYLARDFGLKQSSVEDVFAAGEPSAKKLKELTDYCKTNHIKTIFVEDMVSPKVSETLANEVGAKAEKIYTLESKEENKDYLQSMRDNLEKIYQSLQQ